MLVLRSSSDLAQRMVGELLFSKVAMPCSPVSKLVPSAEAALIRYKPGSIGIRWPTLRTAGPNGDDEGKVL